MPSTPAAGNAVADPQVGAWAPGTRAAAAMNSSRSPRQAKALFLRHAAAVRGGAYHLRRVVEAVFGVLRASYYDPLFERPDLAEDDYYRFRNLPRSY